MAPNIAEVCENCSDLDLRAFFKGPLPLYDSYIFRMSNSRVRWVWEQKEHCRLCDFIEKCRAFRQIEHDPQELDARLEPIRLKRDRIPWFTLGKDDVILRIVVDVPPYKDDWQDAWSPSSLPPSLIGCTSSTGYRGVEGRDGPIRLIPPHLQSLDALKKSVQTCQDTHSCMEHTGNLEPASIPNLLLIDCVSRQVVAAPRRCWYLALSYVWGNQKANPVTIGETLPALPRTIEDAIAVTLNLGYRYLWVDMYCIRQDDQDHVGNQIRHMDLVYRKARVTIIAAAGDNPDFGLPGVSSARQARPHVTINGVSVANFTNNPWGLVNSSVWNSRAWTFQESLFSQCRIFFTAEQTIFNCASEWSCESIRFNQPRIRRLGVRSPPPMFSDSYFHSMIWSLIEYYSRRRLTFSKDILDAFSGVLHAYENLNDRVRNLHLSSQSISRPETG
jgi:Heterokaryon incompatibility protein (HET)